MNRSHQDATSPAELFDLLWESLADVLGTGATATLLRRAIKRAASHTSWSEPVILRGANYVTGRHFFEMGADGLTFYPRVRGPEMAGEPPVDLRRSSEAGFDAHLVKPVSYEDLTRLLGRVGPSDA